MAAKQASIFDLTSAHVAILGMGRLGTALQRALQPLCRALTTWQRSPREKSSESTSYGFPDSLTHADLILLAVSDGAIQPVADSLASSKLVGANQVVLHCAGRHPSSVLGALAQAGCSTGSLHPLQPIAERDNAEELFDGIHVGIEGTPRAVVAARDLATRLGGNPFSLEGVDRTRYHAAAVFASNFTVTLAHIGAGLLADAGLSEPHLPLLLPLMQASLDNLENIGLPAALTGPISRADADTIRAHLACLTPTQRTLYTHLAHATLPIAQAQDKAQDKAWDALQAALDATQDNKGHLPR